MGQMWVGFYILCCCFMVVFSNSPVSFDSPRRSGPPEDGILRQNFVRGSTNVESEKLIRAAETSLRVGKGIGSVTKSKIRSEFRSDNPIGLGDREVGLVQGRLLGENITRTESRDGSVNAAKRRKRVGIDRIDKTYVKQSSQKGKVVQNSNNNKEMKGRRSNRAQDLLKSQEEQSKVNQAQVGFNREKQENKISAMPENRMNPSEVEEESKGDELKTRVKVTRHVPKSIPKSENKAEEENSNSAFELTKKDNQDNGGDTAEEYQRKGLQSGVKGKRAASKPFNKFVREEEGEGPKAAIQENKEKNIGGDGGEKYDRKGLQNGVKGKGMVTKLSPKDFREEEENQIAAVQENADRISGGDSEEELKRKGQRHEVTGKRPVSNLIHKDEMEEPDENTDVAIQENKEEGNGRDSEEGYKRTGSQNKIKGKRPVSKSNHKDEEEEEEEDPNASSQEKTNDRNSKEENKKKGLENERKGKRRISKSSRKDEKEENLDDLMPKRSKDKEDTLDVVGNEEDPNASSLEKTSSGDSEEGNKKRELENDGKGKRQVSKSTHNEQNEGNLENDGKGKRQVSKSTHKEEKEGNLDALMLKSTEKQNTTEIVDNEEDSKRMELQARLEGDDAELLATGKYDKKVNDDALELAEEILTPEDKSALKSLAKIKEYENSKEEMRIKNQDPEADQLILDQTVSNKETKMDNRRGKGMSTQMPKVVNATADESEKREFEEDDIKPRTTSKISETEEDTADESSKEDNTKGSRDNDMEEDTVSETAVTKKQLDSVLPNSEEENVDATEDNDMEEGNASKRVPTKRQSKSNFSNVEEENAGETEDNDVEEDTSKRVPTKKQFKSSFSNQEEKNADESEDSDEMEGTARRVPPKKQSKLNFSNPEEDKVDESEDDNAKVENESETVPINKQPKFNFSNPKEENPDEPEISDVNEDDEINTLPTNKQSKSKLANPREDNADEEVGNDIMEDATSEAVPKHKQSKSDFSMQEEDNVGESVNDDTQSEAESETILDDKHSNSVDSEESFANSTDSVEVNEEGYSDFIQEMQDLPSKFQDTAGKVADKLMPEIQKFSNKSKQYFNRANEGITEGFRPLIGNKYAPFFASMISYIFVLLPLIVVIVLFDQIRTYFPLQKAILYANVYLAAYFATLLLASFLIGMEPMVFFFRNSLTGYIYLQLLEAFGYIVYLILQLLNLIISFSKGSLSAKLAAFLQCVVSIFIGLHYYITIFHRAMAQKAPHTSWMIYGAYTIVFFVLCLFSNIKYGKKQYIQEQYGIVASKKH